MNQAVREVDSQIVYLVPGVPVNRRYVCAGVEVNTGEYAPYDVTVRDGRAIADDFTLDTHGFVLAQSPTAIEDFLDKDTVDANYPKEVEEAVKRLTGADAVATQGWMIRTPGELLKEKKVEGYEHKGGIQPPAGEAHVDYSPACAERVAQFVHDREFPDAPPYKRFIAFSFWRCFSEGPQDWPLAVCDARSVDFDEGETNTLVVVDEIPTGEALFAPIEGEDKLPAAAIFYHRPEHRWWYFSNMNRDEVLLFKFHDSDETKARRVPHTAFYDPSAYQPTSRQSIEFRGVAYFY